MQNEQLAQSGRKDDPLFAARKLLMLGANASTHAAANASMCSWRLVTPTVRCSRRGRVVVLDVRPRVAFAAGHIQGARSIPVDELPKRVIELPRSREIVAYCRGPYCVHADDAVRMLSERGYRVKRLDGGYPEWKSSGYATSKPEGLDDV